ncbi:MAG TPA: hypothetical protein VGC31_08615 [Paenirhodobacter sp.]
MNTTGVPAILHENEAVIPLSKGPKIGVELGDGAAGGKAPILQHMNLTVNSPNPDAFRKSEKQITADMAAAGSQREPIGSADERRHPLGQYEAGFEVSIRLLRLYFQHKIPVIVSQDGLTFRPERARPQHLRPVADD